MTGHRSIKDGPFCWASKAALRRILDKTGEDEKATQRARTVYLALCELASDHGSERFVVAKTLIAYRAGISVRSVQRAFPDLVRAGVLTVERDAQGVGSESAYALLSIPSQAGLTPSHNDRPPSQTGALSLADKVKELKELKEPIAPKGARAVKLKKPRERNLLIDALAGLDGSDLTQVTSSAWGKAAVALKEIREVCPNVTADEIQRRAGHYRQHWPKATLTATAISGNWALCDHPPQARPVNPQPTREYPIPQ